MADPKQIDFSQYAQAPAIDFSQYASTDVEPHAPGYFEAFADKVGDIIKGQVKSYLTGGGMGAGGADASKAPVVTGETFNPFHPIETAGYLVPQPIKDIYAALQKKQYANAAGQATALATQIPVPEEAAATALSSAGDAGSAAVRGAAKATNAALAKAPGAIGAGVGALVGKSTGIPGAAEVGAAGGYALGREVLPNFRVPGERFGLRFKTDLPDIGPQRAETLVDTRPTPPPEQPRTVPTAAERRAAFDEIVAKRQARGLVKPEAPEQAAQPEAAAAPQAAPTLSQAEELQLARNLGFKTVKQAQAKFGTEGWKRYTDAASSPETLKGGAPTTEAPAPSAAPAENPVPFTVTPRGAKMGEAGTSVTTARGTTRFAGPSSAETAAQSPSVETAKGAGEQSAQPKQETPAEAASKTPSDVIDSAIPPSGKTLGLNRKTKAEVDFYVNRGETGKAAEAIKSAAMMSEQSPAATSKLFGPAKLTPEQWAEKMDDERVKAEIEAREGTEMVSTRGPKWTKPDSMEALISDATRRKLPISSLGRMMAGEEEIPLPGTAKGELAKQMQMPGGSLPSDDDLTAILQKSVDEAKAKKAAKKTPPKRSEAGL